MNYHKKQLWNYMIRKMIQSPDVQKWLAKCDSLPPVTTPPPPEGDDTPSDGNIKR